MKVTLQGVVTAAAGIAYLSSTESQIVRFEVTPLMEHVVWTKTTLTSEEVADMFTISDVEAEVAETGLLITGTISANYDDFNNASGESAANGDAGENARIVALLYDAEGDLLCGAESATILLGAFGAEGVDTEVPTGTDMAQGKGFCCQA